MSEDYVVVFAGLSIEAQVMKSSLDAAGIDAFLKDEIMGSIAPGVGAVKLLVRSVDEEEALAVLAGESADGEKS